MIVSSDNKSVIDSFFFEERPLSASFFQLVKYVNAVGEETEISYCAPILSVVDSEGIPIFNIEEEEGQFFIEFFNEEESVPYETYIKKFDELKSRCKIAINSIREERRATAPIVDVTVTDNQDETSICNTIDDEESKIRTVLDDDNGYKRALTNLKEGILGKWKLIAASALLVLFVFFCVEEYRNNVQLTQNITEMDYGKEYSVDELVTANKDKAIIKLADGETSFSSYKLGENNLVFIVEINDKKHEKELAYNVVDKTPPVIDCVDTFQITQFDNEGEIEKEIIDNCHVSDNCDEDISVKSLKIEDTVNTFNTGLQTVRVSATDSSGNTTYKSVEVDVLEKYKGSIFATEAKDYIGQYCTALGVVYSTSYRPDVNGAPTFINVSANYPAYNGMQIVIWGNNRTPKMAQFCDTLERGTYIAVSGTLKMYEGIPEIIVYSTDQIEILREDLEEI